MFILFVMYICICILCLWFFAIGMFLIFMTARKEAAHSMEPAKRDKQMSKWVNRLKIADGMNGKTLSMEKYLSVFLSFVCFCLKEC